MHGIFEIGNKNLINVLKIKKIIRFQGLQGIKATIQHAFLTEIWMISSHILYLKRAQ
jgi:hypothetical protein